MAKLYGLLTVKFSDSGQFDKAVEDLKGILSVYPEVQNRQELEALIKKWKS